MFAFSPLISSSRSTNSLLIKKRLFINKLGWFDLWARRRNVTDEPAAGWLAEPDPRELAALAVGR